ncbi:unnamed protein product, partial [Mesorhabditis belari]|uniref:Man1/Src1-like C-terminal domain-containing protein n=1 Tax=Mesorhabditis belari TaxID=2138241 RepID=A0AAF3JBE9_9BILA
MDSDESADSDPENQPVVTQSRSPLTSSPKAATAKADAKRAAQNSQSANRSIIPGLGVKSAPSKKDTSMSFSEKSRRNYEDEKSESSSNIYGTNNDSFVTRYHTPPASAKRNTYDRPGATPPRTGPSSTRRTATGSSYFAPNLTSTGTAYKKIGGERGLLNLGHTTDEDDTYGQELWKHFTTRTPADELGAPATYYDMKVGGQHTRVEKDPRTGRVRLQHQENIITWWDEVPRLLIIIFTIFFVILAVGYIATSQPGTIHSAAQVVSGTFRDSVTFFYNYLILPTALLAVAAAVVLIVYFAFKRWRLAKDVEENAVFELVEQITDMVRDSAADGEEYISVPHVRDLIFPPAKRRTTELARWERAVEYINENESRIATETRLIRGHECAVWKWLEARKSGWQGKAFGNPTVPLSPNIPKEALTKFLKIRDLVASDGSDRVKAEQDFRSKVHPVIPVHVAYCEEPSTDEKLVFAMFRRPQDAHNAFMALHGEWYNGRLLNVKYVRENRYFDRFPEAKDLAN